MESCWSGDIGFTWSELPDGAELLHPAVKKMGPPARRDTKATERTVAEILMRVP